MEKSRYKRQLLLEELECALLGLVSSLHKVLQRLASEGVLLPGNNPATLRAHEILLVETTGGVAGIAIPHLELRTNRGYLLHFASRTRSHFYIF